MGKLQEPQRNGKKNELGDREAVRGIVDAVGEGEDEDDDGKRDVDSKLQSIHEGVFEGGILREVVAIGGDGNESLHPVLGECSTGDVDLFAESDRTLSDREGCWFSEAL